VSNEHARLEYRADGKVRTQPASQALAGGKGFAFFSEMPFPQVWIEHVSVTKGAHTDVNGRVLRKGMYLKNLDNICIGGRIFRFQGARHTMPL